MKLSILIPSKNEPYLDRTIASIYATKMPSTEVLFMEDDGSGQRKITNYLARKAKGEYLMKLDAHCAVGPAFDQILLEEMEPKTILAPVLCPLDGPTWNINGKKQMTHFVFDTNLVMQHHVSMPYPETMCLQGSCWMVHKDNYWEWLLGDERLPSWGSQGVELGIKAFLNGGKCKTTRRTFYGHVFRHTDADFPYKREEDAGKAANTEMLKRYKNQNIAPLIRAFSYPADWTPELVNSLPT